MNKYIALSENVVSIIFDEFEEYRQKHVSELYSKEFLDSCIVVTNEVVVEIGYIYEKETNTFSKPIIEEFVEEVVVE